MCYFSRKRHWHLVSAEIYRVTEEGGIVIKIKIRNSQSKDVSVQCYCAQLLSSEAWFMPIASADGNVTHFGKDEFLYMYIKAGSKTTTATYSQTSSV